MNKKFLSIIVVGLVLLGISQKSLGVAYTLFNNAHEPKGVTVSIFYKNLLGEENPKFSVRLKPKGSHKIVLPASCVIDYLSVTGDPAKQDGYLSNERIKEIKKNFGEFHEYENYQFIINDGRVQLMPHAVVDGGEYVIDLYVCYDITRAKKW